MQQTPPTNFMTSFYSLKFASPNKNNIKALRFGHWSFKSTVSTMSTLDQERTFCDARVMSALGKKQTFALQ
jgi:hypothetical protein